MVGEEEEEEKKPKANNNKQVKVIRKKKKSDTSKGKFTFANGANKHVKKKKNYNQ